MKKNKTISAPKAAILGASVGASKATTNTLILTPFVVGSATVVSKITTGNWNIGKIAKTTGIVVGSYIAATTIAGAVVGVASSSMINEFIDEFGDSSEEKINEFIEEECC